VAFAAQGAVTACSSRWKHQQHLALPLQLAHTAVVVGRVLLGECVARDDGARAPTPLHERDADTKSDAVG